MATDRTMKFQRCAARSLFIILFFFSFFFINLFLILSLVKYFPTTKLISSFPNQVDFHLGTTIGTHESLSTLGRRNTVHKYILFKHNIQKKIKHKSDICTRKKKNINKYQMNIDPCKKEAYRGRDSPCSNLALRCQDICALDVLRVPVVCERHKLLIRESHKSNQHKKLPYIRDNKEDTCHNLHDRGET